MRRSVLALLVAVMALTPSWALASWDKVRGQLYHSIVRVQTLGATGIGTCTAWPINKDKRLYYTAAHCLDGMVLLDEQQATVIKSDKKLDLAIVRGVYGRKPLPPASRDIREDDEVSGYGFGLALQFPMFLTRKVLHADIRIPHVPFNPNTVVDGTWKVGMSGGPVVNKKGEVVSMVQQGVVQFDIALGRPLRTMKEFAGEMWN